MADSQRTTSVISTQPQSSAQAPLCQDEPDPIVISNGHVFFFVVAMLAAAVTVFTTGTEYVLPIVMGFVIFALYVIASSRRQGNAELAKKNSSLVDAMEKSERRRREAEKTFMEREGTVKELKSALERANQRVAELEKYSQSLKNEAMRKQAEVEASAINSEKREKARLERLAAEENKKLAQDAARKSAAISALLSKLESLRRDAHWETHYLDPTFQADFAKKNPEYVLSALKKKWRTEYDQFLLDEPLRKLADEKAPEVVEWYEARVKIVQLAERSAVGSTLEGVDKVTAESQRNLKFGKYTDQVEEKIALMGVRGGLLAELKDAQNKLPQSLDDEEKELLGQGIQKSLLGLEEERGNENGDTL